MLGDQRPFGNSLPGANRPEQEYFSRDRRRRPTVQAEVLMDAKQLAKLIKKNTESLQRPKGRDPRNYDATLPVRVDDDAAAERAKLFDEMKKREF
jgi:hypothetical protein